MHPCIHNMRAFLSCVAAVRDAAPEGFAAVKVTGPTYSLLLLTAHYSLLLLLLLLLTACTAYCLYYLLLATAYLR